MTHPDYIETRLDRIEAKVDRLLAGPVVTPPPPPPPPPPAPQTGIAAAVYSILPLLRDWTVTLPIGKPGTTDSPWNDYLTKATDAQLSPLIRIGQDPRGRYVDFRGRPATVVTTKNSKYGRNEARETEGAGSWDLSGWPSAGPRFLEAVLAIDASQCTARQRINGMQIHDGSDDVMQIMRRGPQRGPGPAGELDPKDYGLGVMYKDGDAWLELDPAYRDGEVFRCRIEVAGDNVGVIYHNLVTGAAKTVSFTQRGSGWYWKAGDYFQTGGKSEWREPAAAECSVRLYSLVKG
jgi:hypothetical protein